jgi:type I restriction enzyme S subunit
MGSEWPVLTLEQAGITLIDCVHETPTPATQGIPYVAIPQMKDGRIDTSQARLVSDSDAVEWNRKADPRAWDVLLSRRCNPGETVLVSPGVSCVVGQNLVILRADGSRVYPPFLRWLVRSPTWFEQVQRHLNVGAVFDSLKCADIPGFRLPLPPPDEQRRIASVLGALDDKIELNRRMSRTLDETAQAIFNSWFFDRDLPCGLCHSSDWRAGIVDEEFSVVMGQSPPGSTYNTQGHGLPFYQGRADFGDRIPDKRVYCTAPTRFAKSGDSLVSVRAPVGDVNMAAEECAIGRGVAAVRHRSGSASYTYHLMNALSHEFAVHEAGGTVFGSISKTGFANIPVVIPPAAVVNAFESCVGPLDARVLACKRESTLLAYTRDSLISHLLAEHPPARHLREAK